MLELFTLRKFHKNNVKPDKIVGSLVSRRQALLQVQKRIYFKYFDFYLSLFQQKSWNKPIQHNHQDAHLLPSSFQLRTPPMGRRTGRNLALANTQAQVSGLHVEMPQSQAEQRAEAVSKLKLLPMPGHVQEQVRQETGPHFPVCTSFWNARLQREIPGHYEEVELVYILVLKGIFKQMLQVKGTLWNMVIVC